MMQTPTEGSAYYRVIGIDPGGDTIGFCVLTHHIERQETAIEFLRTLEATKELKYNRHLQEIHEDRFVRQIIIQEFFRSLLDFYKPQAVVSEAPFLGRFPQTFLSLTECMQLLRLTVYQYDPSMVFETVDPSNVKLAVGAPAKTKDKQLVANGVANLDVINLTGKAILDYDEHSTDAVAVAWWRLSKLFSSKG